MKAPGELQVKAIRMPKWGMSMTRGLVAGWRVEEGEAIEAGDEILDIETEKIVAVYESPCSGILRRRLVDAGETVAVGTPLGVVAEAPVADAELDAFVAELREDSPAAATAATESGGPVAETLEVGGRRWRYLMMDGGDGTPLVLLHGFGSDLNNWLFNQPALAAAQRVCALDLPGHGASSKEVGSAGVDWMAAAVVEFLDALGLEKAHFAGLSMGGAIALHLACNHSPRVASITLICSAGLGPEIDGDYIEAFLAARRRKELKPVLAKLFADPRLLRREMIDQVLKYKRLDGVEAALAAIAAGFFGEGRQTCDFSGRIGGLPVPAQVIWGRRDRIIPVRHAEALSAALSCHILDDAGHMVHMERAGAVNKLIAEFLQECG